KIREAMLREDLFEAVVGLPSNLFYGTGIPAAVLVLARDKEAARKGKVLFVDASREYGEGTNQNVLRDQDLSRIASAIDGFQDVDKYARVVSTEEIEKNEFNLNVSRYVDTLEEEERIDLAGAVARLRALEAERAEAEARMNECLENLGYA
ncbi:MAG: N-6 DNA methylase, partial [Nannocystaceae bacterium]